MAMGIGAMEMLIVLFFSSGFGLPVGIPPAPEDPMMARIAPESCLYYTTWAAMATPDANSSNHTERLLAEPEIQRLIAEVETRVKQGLAKLAAEQNDPQAALAGEFIPKVVKTILTRSTTVFVSRLEPSPNGIAVEAGAVINLGPNLDEFRNLLGRLEDGPLAGMATRVTLEGTAFSRIAAQGPSPEVTWGFHDNYLIVGMGQGAVEGILARTATEPPSWLAETRERLGVERVATVTYADLGRMIGTFAPIGGPEVTALVQTLGLGQIGKYRAVSGLDKTGCVSRAHLEVSGELKGLFSLAAGAPLEAQDLDGIPADALIAMVARINLDAAVSEVLELASKIQPRAAAEVQGALAQFENQMGVRIREDVFQSLGDVWQVYASPAEGGLVTGWTMSVAVKDRRQLNESINRLIGFYAGMTQQDRRAPRLKSFSYADHTIYYFNVPEQGFVLTPSFCVTDTHLLVGLYPQTIKARLAGSDQETLASAPEVARLLSESPGPISLTYQDTRALFETVYPLVQVALQVAATAVRQEGIDLDMTLLPSSSVISRHLQPAIFATRRTSDGIELITRQSFPGSSIGATAPVTAALLLPAIQSGRVAAQRAQSSNHMKQIGLAMHNYHDVHRALPAAFNTDKDGIPLLSWRVHILPFVEQSALYEKFHLDEPWDSEHNKQLIEEMPEIYRSPESKAAAGMTNYVGVRIDEGILVGPKETEFGKTMPQGTRFRDITDGTSNTVAAVEVNDENTVIWTKPDDYRPTKQAPLAGMIGVRPNSVLILYCDGSVRSLPDDTSAATVHAIFTRNGGEIVNLQ